MTSAPVALFVYNRPWHTRRTVEALLANFEVSETPLYIFSDAPRDGAANKAVMEVRSFLREITGFKSVSIIERETNFGLARSIIDGVSHVCEEHGRVIVLEDDLVTSPYFLKFMNEGLEKYQDEQRIISIHGYVYPVEQALPETFFLKGADCWGWATWKRGWDMLDPDGQRLLDELKRRKLTREFDFDGSYPYTRMLKNQIAGKNNSWAVRWYASAFLQDKLTLYPGRSLVHNIGLDGSGTHCSRAESFAVELERAPVTVGGISVEESGAARQQFGKFLKRTRSGRAVMAASKVYREIWNKITGSGCHRRNGFAKKMMQALRQYVLKQQYAPGLPGIWLNPFYHSRSGLRKAIGRMAKRMKGRMLDVGCGRKPYREMFPASEYIGLEIDSPGNRANKQADFFYDGSVFPFPERDFDGVLCNQVLEHVFLPDRFLGEIHRVLKPDGLLLLTVPFVWDEHEQPWDYARYASFGLKSLLERNGFEVLEQQKINADVRALFQLANAYLYKVLWTRWQVVNLLICAIAMAPLNLLGVLLYKVLPANPDFYLDQAVLARKVANG